MMMAIVLHKFKLIFLLIISVGILLACSKSNASQSSTDSTLQKDTTIKTYLALGDSYTIGQSVGVTDRYPVQTIGLLNSAGVKFHSAEIIATTGWTTEDLQNAINNYHFSVAKYDIVTLLIGVNNQYQGGTQSEYKDQFTALLKKSISLAGGNSFHVIVISIPDYSVTPFANERNDKTLIASEIDSFNMINKQIATAYNTNYINITDQTRKAATDLSLLASDGLHYSGKEYLIWANMLSTEIETILK